MMKCSADPRPHRREQVLDFGEVRSERGPVGVFEVEAGIAVGEIDHGETFHQRVDGWRKIGVERTQFAGEVAEIVCLFLETNRAGSTPL